MRLTKENSLSPSCLRVLAVILKAAERHQAIGLRDIQKRLGLASPMSVHEALCCLKQHGLITIDGRKKKTIRPKCYLRIYKNEP